MPSKFTQICMLIVGLMIMSNANGQTLGGSSIFNFMKLPFSPQLSSLGGDNISTLNPELSMASFQPSLLRKEMTNTISATYNRFYAGIAQLQGNYAFHSDQLNTTFLASMGYLNYGTVDRTDPSGNILGTFRPYDAVLQFSASKKYLEHWYYGATLKYIISSYDQYTSNALAMDVGLNYLDSAKGWQAGFLATNMGSQIRVYNQIHEDLPFDLKLGISKRFRQTPFQLSITANRLHRFNLISEDSAFINNGLKTTKPNFLNNAVRHLVFGLQIFPIQKIELSVGYNILRKAELSVPNTVNGLTGFSAGMALLLAQIQFRYAMSGYQGNSGYHQVGFQIKL
ncbi:MAG: type IX secretion system protein PorQ [Chitinophagaceae bacterium]